MKIGLLAATSLLLYANAFASPKDAVTTPSAVTKKGNIMPKDVALMLSPVIQKAGLITIEVGGQKIAKISMEDQPEGAGLYLTGNSMSYNEQSNIVTLKGKFSIGVRRKGKTLWQMSVTDGTGTITPRVKTAALKAG